MFKLKFKNNIKRFDALIKFNYSLNLNVKYENNNNA